MIDLYCERTTAGLLAEPWNAVSNLAFAIAAVAAACEARRGRRAEGLLLASLVGLIALGSTAFHAFASAWAQWLDVLPIVAFQLAFLGCYLVRLHGLRTSTALAVTGVFFATLLAAASSPTVLNGSLAYLPAAVVLGWVGLDGWNRDANRLLPAAATLFPLALAARTLDHTLCPGWPHGTHWLWHLLNGCVLWLLLAGYLRSPPMRTAGAIHRRPDPR